MSTASAKRNKYVGMRSRPDTWVREYLDTATSHPSAIFMDQAEFLPGHGLLSRRGKRRRSDNLKNACERFKLKRLQSSSNDQSDVYVCRSNAVDSLSVRDNRAGPVLEYCHSGSPRILLFAELVSRQRKYLQDIENEYTFLHPDKHNLLLDYLLLCCKRQRTHLAMLNLGNNTTTSSMVTILGDDDEHPASLAEQLTDNVWCTTLKDTSRGALSVNKGVVVQFAYRWPFAENFGTDHIKLVARAFGRTPRAVTKMENLYQNLGPRSTFQCPANLGSHPQTKAEHDNYCRRHNMTLPHLFTTTMRNSLRYQSHAAGFSCGTVLSPTLKLVSSCVYLDLHAPCLFSLIYSCTRHKDNDLASHDESRKMREHWDNRSSNEIQRFSRAIGAKHPEFLGRLPLETTCAWTVGKNNDDYELRSCFANLDAGVGLDISSNAISDTEVVGCTFLGACFDHCTTKTMWVRKKDGYVRMSPPPETPLFCVFAWGDHVERARERARARRQAKTPARQSARE